MIPISGSKQSYARQAETLMKRFRENRSAKFISAEAIDYSNGIYEVIEFQITPLISKALHILNRTLIYIHNRPIELEIMISNIGLAQTIVDCVLKFKGILSYLITNGLMPATFGDDSKYAKHINCYGVEIKKGYFQNAENVVYLGDPRMDAYINIFKNRASYINRIKPTVTIGASGFNSIDLISHAAVEFDFMFDVLTAFHELKKEGHSFTIIIKVRPNGVLAQYESFVAEYFPDLETELRRTVPIGEILQKTDLYISIYSQTLFQASCLGIPVIYYKNDKEFQNPPFDNKSELVTVDSVKELKQRFLDFKLNNTCFDGFMDKAVMEKYIGPLDGKNLSRNLNFIYGILNK
jgi:hypothetical protein